VFVFSFLLHSSHPSLTPLLTPLHHRITREKREELPVVTMYYISRISFPGILSSSNDALCQIFDSFGCLLLSSKKRTEMKTAWFLACCRFCCRLSYAFE
jgi:hypothetical protein